MSPDEDPTLSGPLADLKGKADGFSSPSPAYFEALAEQAIATGKQPARERSLWLKWQYAAAGVFFLLLATFLLQEPATSVTAGTVAPPPLSAEALLAELETEDIELYLNDYVATDLETEIYPTDYSEIATDE